MTATTIGESRDFTSEMEELMFLPNNVSVNNPAFIVEDTELSKCSAVYLSPTAMNSLNIWFGAVVLVEGNQERKTACTVLREETVFGEDKIRMNKLVRRKLGVSLGQRVSLNIYSEIPKGNKIILRPVRDQECKSEFIRENFFEAYLKPYFFQAYRPLHEGDEFEVTSVAKTIKFQVVKAEPSPFCIVGPATIIECEGGKIAKKRRRGGQQATKKRKLNNQVSINETTMTDIGQPAPALNDRIESISDPVVVNPVTENPVIENPVIQTPIIENPVIENPVTENPVVENPRVENLLAEDDLEIRIIENEPSTTLTSEQKRKIAHSLRGQGKLEEARNMLEEVLEAQQNEPGSTPDLTLPTKQDLVSLLLDMQEFAEVARMFLGDLHLRDSPDLDFLETKFSLAMAMADHKNYDDAVDILSDGLAVIMSLNYSSVKVLKIKFQLATVLFRQKKKEAALELLYDEPLTGPNFPNSNSKFVFALPKIVDTLNSDVNQNGHSSDESDLLHVKYYVGWFYSCLNKPALAIEIIEEVLPRLKDTLGSDHQFCHLVQKLLDLCKTRILTDSG